MAGEILHETEPGGLAETAPGLFIGDRYQIQALIAEGMAGPVYRGWDGQAGRPVAIKTLRAEVIERDPGMLRRFRQEGEALRQLNHPNIVHILDLFSHEDDHYLVMEYAAAGSLRNLLQEQGQLPLEHVLEIGLDIADALARTHRLGIIHRDLKPENVLLFTDGTPRLSDFGVAHFVQRTSLAPPGSFAGTWAYMPPEAFMGQLPDERADIWSFGVMLFELLAGRCPFVADTLAALITAVLNRPLPDLRTIRPDLPADLYRLIEMMLLKEHDARLASVRLVGATLEALAGGYATPLPAMPAQAQPQKPGNLPALMTAIVGRTAEVEHITARLKEPHSRLLTLLGPGGVGKTRLALEVAHELAPYYQDGVYFVDLAPINEADRVAGRIAQVLGVDSGASHTPVAEIVDFLQGKGLLLLLDNFEQVLAGATVVSDLLAGAPGLDVLATSREALRLYGEHEFWVRPLALPKPGSPDSSSTIGRFAAIALFVQRAQAADPVFQLTPANVGQVVEICTRLDGLPLAIELAAARARRYPPAQILNLLDDSLATLVGGPRDHAGRHQTLRAAIDWSYQLLEPAERVVLARFAIFQGGCSWDAALTILAGAAPSDAATTSGIIATLESLVDKSLLVLTSGDNQTARFDMLETIKQFAQEKLAELGEAEKVRDRHCDYFVELSEQAVAGLRGPQQAGWSAALRRDYDNLRAALGCLLGGRNNAQGLRLAGALAEFWYYEGLVVEGEHWIRLALARLEGAAAPVQVRVLNGAGMMAYLRGDHDQGRDVGEAALAIARAAGDRDGWAWALFWLSAHATSAPAYYEHGLVLIKQALAMFHELDQQPGLSWGYNQLGELNRLLGNFAAAQEAYLDSLAICRENGNQRREAISLVNLSYVSYHQGHYRDAENYIRNGLAILAKLKLHYHAAIALGMLAGPVAKQGRARRAARLLGASAAIFERMSVSLQAADQGDIDGYAALARSLLDADAYAKAWDEGHALSLDEALAYAQVG